ncbi:MAG: hypothetical protein ACTSRG_25875 [Candidatus Helarchaeota archaeon]
MKCGLSLKKQKRLTPLEYLEGELGDAWIWIAFEPVNKVVVAYTIGKRAILFSQRPNTFKFDNLSKFSIFEI